MYQKNKKTFLIALKSIMWCFVWMLIFPSLAQTPTLPPEYHPNYKINDTRNQILDTLVKIEAQAQINENPPGYMFAELNEGFKKVFPYLPQEKVYKITYEQCLALTEELSMGFSFSTFTTFLTNCHRDLQKIMKEINAKYTVKTDVKVSPQSGPTPLTVTFDARGSIDPSNETIPNDNFFWRYKDIDGTDKQIGRGAVLHHTFTKEGRYVVHMVARSAVQDTQGILDGTKDVVIDVSPKAATLILYVNGKKAETDRHVKIGTKEGLKGVVFDGSASLPKGGRKILSHMREIQGGTNFSYKTKIKNGKPGSIKVVLPENGEYTVKLTITDNENNKVSETFLLKISDPVAIIKQTPENNGTTTTEFLFDGTKSYSIQSRIKLYTREVFDENGKKLYTTQTSSFKYKFIKPGPYTIKLTVTDEIGEKDDESTTIQVLSTSPIAQFSFKPLAGWEFPSQFLFDASATTDIDVNNGYDTLTYERSFGKNKEYIVVETGIYQNTKEKQIISFNEPGTYTVTLQAKDAYGQISEPITKEIVVKSSLRPIIKATPKAAVRGTEITFVATANKDIISYNRNFGDGMTRMVQTNTIKHTYEKAGIYVVKLEASTAKGEKNTVTTEVFIGEKNKPIAVYTIKDRMQTIMKQIENCEIPKKDREEERKETSTSMGENENGDAVLVPAYKVDRLEEFMVDMIESVNTKGENDKLKFYFQPQDGDIYSRPTFQYKFTDMGCRYIDVIVEDTQVKTTDKKTIWFKVYNALPTLENITLSFPQYGNEVGIGFQGPGNEQAKKNILSDPKFDPLTVKVEANGAKDPDGSISYYTRYYYDKNNPDHILESKTSTYPYAYFSLPKTIPGEYAFGVRMTDNDGGERASEEIIGFSTILPFLPDEKNLDIPMVVLIADRINIKAGEEVTFTVKAKILSQRKDFDAVKVNKFDFDGDGNFDLVTKNDVVKYVYKEPKLDGVIPKVEVMYRGYKGIAFGEKITIKQGLKPILMYTLVNKTILIRDNSIGSISKKRLCFDRITCKTNESFVTTEGNTFVFTYPDYGQYVLEYEIEDDYGNKAVERQVITIQEPKTTKILEIKSLPEPIDEKGEETIRVGKNLGNAILLYINYNGKGTCYADVDISYDSDGDKKPDNDRDLECNTASSLVKYNPSAPFVIGRVFYDKMTATGTLELGTKNFIVKFIDYETILTPDEQAKYNRIGEIIKKIEPTTSGNSALLQELVNLQTAIQEKGDMTSIIVTINDILTTETLQIDKETLSQIKELLQDLADGATVAAMGGGPYEQAKQDILAILPENLKADIKLLFEKFESLITTGNTIGDKERAKTHLQNILNEINKNTVVSIEDQTDNQLLKEDVDLIVIPNICAIAEYYKIETKLCTNIKVAEAATAIAATTSAGTGSILKRVLIVVGILGLAFLGIIIFFALKAKNQEEQQQT